MAIRKREWTTKKGVGKSAWVVDYKDSTGKRCIKTFRLKKDADAFNTKAGWEVSQGVHMAESGSITIAEAAVRWIAAAEAKKLEPKTIAAYESTARLHIVPHIGKEKITKLRKPQIEDFKDKLLADGKSQKRVKRTIGFLSLMLAEMERKGLVAQNVASGVRVVIPTRDATDIEIPDQDELKALIKHADDDFRPFLMTAMLTGMRASELRGLTWDCVDFDDGVIRVRQRADEKGKIGSPKSKAGRRSIPMSPRLLIEMKKWKLRGKGSLQNLVFPSPEGMVWSYANMMNRKFWPLQVSAGVTVELTDPDDGLPIWDEDGVAKVDAKYSLHALRHGAASLWIRQGVDWKRLQVWLGHSTVQLTIDRYGHLMKDPVGDATIMANAERALLG